MVASAVKKQIPFGLQEELCTFTGEDKITGGGNRYEKMVVES